MSRLTSSRIARGISNGVYVPVYCKEVFARLYICSSPRYVVVNNILIIIGQENPTRTKNNDLISAGIFGKWSPLRSSSIIAHQSDLKKHIACMLPRSSVSLHAWCRSIPQEFNCTCTRLSLKHATINFQRKTWTQNSKTS